MAMSRLDMKQIHEILRLRFELKQTYRQIAASVNCGSSSVGECLRRFVASGIGWPLPDGLGGAHESRLES